MANNTVVNIMIRKAAKIVQFNQKLHDEKSQVVLHSNRVAVRNVNDNDKKDDSNTKKHYINVNNTPIISALEPPKSNQSSAKKKKAT